MSIDLIEFTWIAVNAVAFILTCVAVTEARADQAAVKMLNGYARELAAGGIVRREWVRLYLQFVFLVITVPALFTVAPERTLVSYLIIGLLMSGAIGLLWSTLKDRRDRQRMTVLVAADVLNERESALVRLEAKLDANTEISQQASDHADRAYHEANSVNEKIATQGAAIIKQGESMDADRARNVITEETIEDTHEKVGDLHEGTAPTK